MLCVRCNTRDTTCVDDMLQEHFVAEIYVCNECEGTIEVVYKDKHMTAKNIKEYRYVTETNKGADLNGF